MPHEVLMSVGMCTKGTHDFKHSSLSSTLPPPGSNDFVVLGADGEQTHMLSATVRGGYTARNMPGPERDVLSANGLQLAGFLWTAFVNSLNVDPNWYSALCERTRNWSSQTCHERLVELQDELSLSFAQTRPELINSAGVITSQSIVHWLGIKIQEQASPVVREQLIETRAKLQSFPDLAWKVSAKVLGNSQSDGHIKAQDHLDWPKLIDSIATTCGISDIEPNHWTVSIWQASPQAFRPHIAISLVHKNVIDSVARALTDSFGSTYGANHPMEVLQTAVQDDLSRGGCGSNLSQKPPWTGNL